MTVVRHGAALGAGTRWTPSRRHLVLAGIVVLVAAAVALGVWWWKLMDVTDPISADPVRSDAVVTSSPACGEGSTSTVRYVDGGGSAEIDGCGFTVGSRIAVESLRGNPGLARKAGTTVAGSVESTRLILAIGILACGLGAVVSAGMLLLERRGRRRRDSALSVADLQQRLLAARNARAASDDAGEPAGAGESAAPVAGDEAATPQWEIVEPPSG